MQALIEIEGRIVVTDILTERFCCDLAACRGMCCVEAMPALRSKRRNSPFWRENTSGSVPT